MDRFTAIEALLREDRQHIEGVDYSNNDASWVIAEKDDEIVACCMVATTRPVAQLAFFVVAQGHRNKTVTWNMMAMIIENIRAVGCTHYMGFGYLPIDKRKPFHKTARRWIDTILRHGGVKITGNGSMYIRSTATLIPAPRAEMMEMANGQG